MISKNEYNKRILWKYFVYAVGVIFGVCVLLWLFRFTNTYAFFEVMENKTFDLRQKNIAMSKQVDKNIVIATVDNESYEYLTEKYGEWPMPRNVYADIVNYIEKQKPVAIAFDLMFVNSMKSSKEADVSLANAFKKNPNLYTAINFDSLDEQIRKAQNLPDKFKVNLNNNSKINFKNPYLSYSNCRVIIDEIMSVTSNIGHINLVRADDGIARKINPFVSYKGDFYPHLALKVGLAYIAKTDKLDVKNFYVDDDMNLVLGKRKVPLDYSGSVTLNWYGPSGEYNPNSFRYIPLWKLEKLTYGEKLENDEELSRDFFKDKVVYVGVSATSMYDIKSTPTERNMPGVELHTTFINNLIDNNFIKRAPVSLDIFITLVLSLIIGFIVLSFSSTVAASLTSIMLGIFYSIVATWVMRDYNLWISMIVPLAFAMFTFIGVYLVKYFRKSQDFEHTYKLATTELYNHRYFQEQMILNIETAKRYNSHFSLILVDIDFFKKFNDKFGHQSGDAVLKQVAQTLKKNVRSTDLVCRYGGEEMSVILTNTNNEDANLTAQKLCDEVAGKIFDLANGQKEHVTISLGVATYPQHGDAPQALIEYADKGLYKAKENGRNQVGKI